MKVQRCVPYDVIVVGAGATGSWATKELTERGWRVLLLEAGASMRAPPLTSTTSATKVAEVASRYEQMRERQRTQSNCYACTPYTNHLFVDDVDNPYTASEAKPFFWIRGRQLGGRACTWAGYTYRMSDYEFKAASRDGHGTDWPISYQDLASYYDRIERFLRVRGSNESIPNLPDGEFCRPTALTPGEARLKSAVESRWPERKVIPGRAISMESLPATSASSVEMIASPGVQSVLAAALRTGRLEIRTHAIASHIIVGATGKAAGVAYVDGASGAVQEVSSRAIVLCASTIESTRLLLNSRSRHHPEGIGNSSGLVGRYLMDHVQVKIRGHAEAAAPECVDCVNPNGIYIPQFRNVATRTARFMRGYGIQGGVPRGTGSRDVREDFWMAAFGEMLPRIENQVSLSPGVKDAWGIAVPHIECSHGDNEVEMAQDAQAALEEMADAAGFHITRRESTLNRPGLCVHEVGTARMGEDPRTSVLNKFNQSWDVDNLFVSDGACFVSQGYQNPTLTMMALTARACDYLAVQLRDGHI